MTPVEIGLAALLILILSLSVVVQLPGRSRRWVQRRDHYGMLPIWSFFAPNPGRHDYHLLRRDRRDDGSVTLWEDVTPSPHRSVLTPWWDPSRRTRKAVFDIVSTLQVLAQHPERTAHDAVVTLSVPYLSIVNHLSDAPRPANHLATQFMVVQVDPITGDTDTDAFQMRSKWHRLVGTPQ